MKKYLLLLTSILGILLFSNCAKDEEEMNGIITGLITDADNGELLQGVSVTLSGLNLSQTTGGDGRFTFNEVTPGHYTISISKTGYASNMKSITVYAGQTAQADMQLSVSSTQIKLTPSLLDFGTAHNTLSFTITATTGGDVAWNISTPSSSCLKVSPKTGTTRAGNSTQITVTLDRTTMPNDTYEIICVNVIGGGSATITVNARKVGIDNSDNSDNSGTLAVSNGLMAYYTFDDGTANDHYENEVDGQLVGNPTFINDTPNGSGKALFINGTKQQYVNIPQNPLQKRKEAAISMWVKDIHEGLLISGGKDSDKSNYIGMPGITITTELKLRTSRSAYKFNYTVYGYSEIFANYQCSNLQDGKWHMMTVNYTDNATLHVDGKLVDNFTMYAEYDNTNLNGTKIQIGGNAEGLNSYFNTFKVDNVRIYSRTLTNKEIKTIYDSER